MHACAAGAQSSQMKEKEGERGREGKNKQKKITKAAIFCKFGHRLQAEECQSGPHPAASAPSASERLGERRGGWRGRSGPEGEGAHGAMWSKGTPLRSARRASGTPRARSAGWAHTCRDAPGGRPRRQRQAVHTPVLAHAGCHAHACVVPSAVSPRGRGGVVGGLGAVLAVCAARPDGHTDPTAVLGAQPQRAQTSQRGVGGGWGPSPPLTLLSGDIPPPPQQDRPRATRSVALPALYESRGGRGGTGHTQRTEPPAAPHRAQSGLPLPHTPHPPLSAQRGPPEPPSAPRTPSPAHPPLPHIPSPYLHMPRALLGPTRAPPPCSELLRDSRPLRAAEAGAALALHGGPRRPRPPPPRPEVTPTPRPPVARTTPRARFRGAAAAAVQPRCGAVCSVLRCIALLCFALHCTQPGCSVPPRRAGGFPALHGCFPAAFAAARRSGCTRGVLPGRGNPRRGFALRACGPRAAAPPNPARLQASTAGCKLRTAAFAAGGGGGN